MPTVLRTEGYRFFFYSLENDEPPHIHVEHGDRLAKYWLELVELASSRRFKAHELGVVRTLVEGHQRAFLKAWHEHLDD
ncbi:MAG TPA: DUF4160 domain-containing protein [Devosiaceae bacterium]|jgi:hypothetical protein|nr:DUF4160 domain-containing protein [Devosiaceae bacterium]